MKYVKFLVRLLVFGSVFGLGSVAHATIGFLKGETSEGLNKICYYNVLGDTYTKNISNVSICPVSININTSNQPRRPSSSQKKTPSNPYYSQPFSNPISYKKTGFLSGERTSGMNKICFYNVLGNTHTLNVSSVSICPLSAKL